MEIGILGGTGKAGNALAARLAQANHQVTIGSRSTEKAKAEVEKIQKNWALELNAGENSVAANADVIIVATPPEAALATVKNHSSEIGKKLIISMCNALQKTPEGFFVPIIDQAAGSIAQAIQKELPESQVVAAFHHLPAKELADLSCPIKNDVLICSNFEAALNTTSEIISSIKNLRPLNAGPLDNAVSLEAFTPTLLNLSKIYKANASIEITGLD